MDTDQIRFAIFITVFFLMLVLERFLQRHPTVDSKWRRLGINLALTGLNTLVIKGLFGAAAVGTALMAEERGWGLLNLIPGPDLPKLVFAVIMLDFLIYLQHVVFHKVPLLWRLHIVHHSDLDLDVSSGLRFHPVEIVISRLYKMAVILLLGPSPSAVIVFEVVLNGMAQFTHSNIRLPGGIDRILRFVFVTPDMHRIHHSVERRETDSNYGFNLSIWDRWFGTYIQDAKRLQPDIVIGVPQFRLPAEVTFMGLLMMPGRVKIRSGPPAL